VRPDDDIAACAASHATLLARLDGLTDEDARAPSLLPGWSLGHVLTHVARNADSVVRRLAAAAEGELVTQYEGGAEGRAAQIEAGASRSAAELVSDVTAASAAVDGLFATAPDEAWAGEVLRGSGPDRMPTARLAYSRWREVEIHHVDLGRGYLPSDWPPALLDRLLPELLRDVAGRAEPAALTAWLIGRGPAPDVAPWG
jgi:maleylpyruvate isomerase